MLHNYMYVIPCHRKYSGHYNQCVIQVVYDGKVGCTVPLKSKLPLLVSFLMSRESCLERRESRLARTIEAYILEQIESR